MAKLFANKSRNIIRNIIIWHQYRKTCNQMYSLSDHTLNDIGVNRSEIPDLVANSLKNRSLAANDNSRKAA